MTRQTILMGGDAYLRYEDPDGTARGYLFDVQTQHLVGYTELKGHIRWNWQAGSSVPPPNLPDDVAEDFRRLREEGKFGITEVEVADAQADR